MTRTTTPAADREHPGAPPTGGAPDAGWRRWWAPAALTAICVLAGVLYVWDIGAAGWGNPFYSAAVRAMSDDPTAFLFGSLDRANVVTVDKPPLALWPQVFAVWIFGYHEWSVLLPEVLEGVATVFLLHRTVRMWWRDGAAGSGPDVASGSWRIEGVPLLAALALALTPVLVALDRTNNADTLLVLLLVAAAYAVTRSLYRGSTTWLITAAVAVGFGFVTKMLAAWMIVPALALAFLLAAPGSWGRRLLQLAAAGVALVVSSFWWPAMVSLWPGAKPWIGGSSDGSAWDLIIGYNGLGRVFGQQMGPAGGGRPGGGTTGGMPPGGGPAAMFGGGGGANPFGDPSGPFRLLGSSTGTQFTWLLPVAVIALVGAAVVGVRAWRSGRFAQPGDGTATPERLALGGWVLWGSWLVVVGAVFSFSRGIFHPYYTSALAPPVAALTAAGAAWLWRAYHGSGAAGWLAPAAVAVTAGWAFVLAGRSPGWNPWVGPTAVVLGVAAVLALVGGRIRAVRSVRLSLIAAVLAVLAVLLGPTVWSTTTAFTTRASPLGGLIPIAGPSTPLPFGPPRGAGPAGTGPARTGGAGPFASIASGRLAPEQQRLLDYVTAQSPGVAIPLAVEGGAIMASPYLIASDSTIVAMGGFMGADPAPDVPTLAGWMARGRGRFVLLGGPGPMSAMGGGAAAQRTSWVRGHCRPVDPADYGGTTSPGSGAAASPLAGFAAPSLYRCGD